MKTVVLLGTRHTIQRGNIQEDSFKFHIKQLCTEHNIKAIAEEIDDFDTYIVQAVSEEIGIPHKIIEPTPDEKKNLEIEEVHIIEDILMTKYSIKDWDEQYEENRPPEAFKEYRKRLEKTYRQRENEWLKRIKKLNTWPLLVICGNDHSQPFYELLILSDIDVIKRHRYKVNNQENLLEDIISQD